MRKKNTALFVETMTADPVWTTIKGYPTYGHLYTAARTRRRQALEADGKTRDQVQKALDVFDWAYNRFTEAGEVFLEDHIDDRILNRAVSDRVLQRTLRRLTKKSHDEVRSILRCHVRPVALEIARTAGTYATLGETLVAHMCIRRISVDALAAEVGMRDSTLRAWITHDVPPTTARNLQRLAAIERVLQAPPGTLMRLAKGPRPIDDAPAEDRDIFLSLADALQHFMDLGGWTIGDLAEAAGMKAATLHTWLKKDCRPRRDDTVAQLQRIEAILKLASGTLMQFTDGVVRYMDANAADFGVSSGIWAIIRGHFPDDFDARSRPEQQEIIDWALKWIWKIPRDEDDAGGDRSAYRCQFRGVKFHAGTKEGLFYAPEGLQREYEALLTFKTVYPTPVGKRRGMMWRDGTIEARTSAIGTFFGAVARAVPEMPMEVMSFLNAGDADLVRKALGFIVDRRGHPTPTIITVVHALIALFNPDDGFVIQHREIFLDRYPGLPDGEGLSHFCRETVAMLYRECNAWQDKITAGRSSFRAVDPVLRSDHPLDAYHTIVEEIDARTPPRTTQELEWARCVRRSMMIHFLEILPLRRKDVCRLQLFTTGETPPSFAELTRRNHGIIYFAKGQWRFRQPKTVFKNHGSPATSDIDVALVNWRGFYDRMDRYLEARTLLLHGGPDHGQFFTKDNSQANSQSERPMGPVEFGSAFTSIIRSYGVHNPYTGTGAIIGLGVHRPQSVRHVVATHLAKVVDYDAAAARLFDTQRRVMETYADYQAVEKFEDADAGYGEAHDDPLVPRRRQRQLRVV
jgi:transcriptional regulator with XRE-family HTH domain